MNNSSKHARVNDILLAPLERPALKWLAAHSPAWLTPDICTGIGVVGAILIFASYILSRYHIGFLWLASLGFVLNWYGDSLDGTLARYRKIERPIYGFFVDHTTDAVTQALVFFGLGMSPFVNMNVALFTLIGYMMLSVYVYVRTCVVSEFKISYGKLGPTEARVISILLNTLIFFFGKQVWQMQAGPLGQLTFSPYDLFVGAIGVLLYFFFFSSTWRETYRLFKIGR